MKEEVRINWRVINEDEWKWKAIKKNGWVLIGRNKEE